jgi:hypothetical protein
MAVASIISPSIPLSLPRQALDSYHEGFEATRRHTCDGT